VRYQSKTYSLSDEVVLWLEGLRADYGSINKGLLAVMAVNGSADKNESIQHSDPRTIPGISVGLPEQKPEAGGFKCRCVHANCGKKFMAPTRYATLCDDCKEKGHLGVPKDCGECLLLQGGL